MLLSLTQKTVLICRLDQKLKPVNHDKATITDNLLTCLSQAAGEDFELIIISFSLSQIAARQGIIDLCACLKNRPLSKNRPLCAVMTALHRSMAVKLQRAGVEFLKIRNPDVRFDVEQLSTLIREANMSVRIERVLGRLCPFLNYFPIDAQREIITCGAYKNRMVLGGERLHEICESEAHLFCHYFLNPKVHP